ncbi:tyrosine-type recombinase/integrase [Rothia nasimurium]|uniref:tyrosine-type recombinase/integrase n=1 Tax=Rothia nasimurium TaxID=85336 RepID=UPI001F3CDCE4|nr:site-specific integrase [Rothia nasimurium]
MASIHKYLAEGKGTERQRTRWRVYYKNDKDKWTSKAGFKTKAEAQQFMSGVEVAVSRNEYVTPSGSRAKVGELAPAWLSKKETALAASSYRKLESAWRIHVAPVWGDRVLKTILPTEVEMWVSDLQNGTTTTGRAAVGASITIRCHEILAGVLDDAVKDKRLLTNPARGVKLPRKQPRRNVYLTHEEVAALAKHAEYPELVYVLAYTGIRWGEAVGLQVKHVDFERCRLSIERNLVEDGGRYEDKAPKSGKARLVPFPQFITPHLRAACKDKMGEASVFTHKHGGGYLKHPHSYNGWFVRALAAAGVEKKITPHDLRHSAASFAVASGAPVPLVQRMLGHKSAAMTLDVYADLFEEQVDSVADAMDAAYRAAAAPGGLGLS